MRSKISLRVAIGLAACVGTLAAATPAVASDDPRQKVIAELRAFEDFPAKSFWSPAQLRAKIGMAQVDVRDLEGARITLKAIVDATARDQYYQNPNFYSLVKRLAVAEAANGDVEAAKKTLDAIHGKSHDSRYYCQDSLAVALAAAGAGKQGEASAILGSVEELLSRLKDGDRRSALFQLAMTQVSLGLQMDAARSAKELEALTNKIPEGDWYRAYELRDLGHLYVKLSQQDAAKRHFASALEAAKRHNEQESGVRQQIAVELAEAGDISAGIQLAMTIPDSASRDCALCSIAKIQLKQGNRAGAEETAGKIKHFLQYQNESVLAIVEIYADLSDTKKAIEAAETIKNASRRAQAMLTIAAIMAEGGDKKAGLKLADSLTFPASQFPLPAGSEFSFTDPKTWGGLYEMDFAITMTSFLVAQDDAATLTAAAIRCRVAVRGRGDIMYGEALESWDARKAGKAQALAGDAGGAFLWVDRLSAENRLEGLCGIAEGIGMMMDAKKSRQDRQQ